MNEENRKRYEELKKRNTEKIKKIEYSHNILLQECLVALNKNQYTLNDKEEKLVFEMFNVKVPTLEWGRVDWRNINSYNKIENVFQLLDRIKNNEYYIIWGKGLPILKSNIDSIIDCIDDITAVSFDTWLFATNYSEIIEFYHEGEIVIGEI